LLPTYLRAKFAEIRFRGLKHRDLWFYSHFVTAANEVGRHLARHIDLLSARILDFGCGDGYMALGLLRFNPMKVIGVDLNPAFESLPEICERYLDLENLPEAIAFQQVEEGKRLPFENQSFEVIYSWSVFEHLRDVRQVMQELYRVLVPDGLLFIQIEPLFHSPFGSHLHRLVSKPWAHLLMNEDEFLERAKLAEDQVSSIEKDLAYQRLEFDCFKNFLINEYKNLNQITAQELIKISRDYFKLISLELRQSHPYSPPEKLLLQYSEELLLTNELLMMVKKCE
jgi:SAM-dependent methyltransferase